MKFIAPSSTQMENTPFLLRSKGTQRLVWSVAWEVSDKVRNYSHVSAVLLWYFYDTLQKYLPCKWNTRSSLRCIYPNSIYVWDIKQPWASDECNSVVPIFSFVILEIQSSLAGAVSPVQQISRSVARDTFCTVAAWGGH